MIPPAHAPAFLAANGWGGATILPLAGDASFRRYFRVVDHGRTAVLMDAPPEHEDLAPFLVIARHLDARPVRAAKPWHRPRVAGCCCSRISAIGSSGRCCERRRGGGRGRDLPRRGDAARAARRAAGARRSARLRRGGDAARDRAVPRMVCVPRSASRSISTAGCGSVGRGAGACRVAEPAGSGAARLSCRQHHPARSRGAAAARPARFPGRARRAPRLRSRLAAAGCAARRVAGARGRDARRLCRGRGHRRHVDAFRADYEIARRAAEHQDPRHLHPPVETRRQAQLSALSSRASGAISSATSRIPRWRRSPTGSPPTCRPRCAPPPGIGSTA